MVRSYPPESRADFVQALEILADDPVVRFANRRLESEQMLTFVDRPYATWSRVFGKPQSVEEHYDLFTRRPFKTWTHSCEDGIASCTGVIYRQTSGRQWVTVELVRMHKPLPDAGLHAEPRGVQ